MGINRRNFLKVAGRPAAFCSRGSQDGPDRADPQTRRPQEEALSSTGSSSTRPSASAAALAKRGATRSGVCPSGVPFPARACSRRKGKRPRKPTCRKPVPNGEREADLRSEAVHALHRASCALAALQGDGEDARRTDRLPQGSLHGVPILNDFLPFDIPKFEYDSASRS